MQLDHPERGGIINSGLITQLGKPQADGTKGPNNFHEAKLNTKHTMWHSRHKHYHAVPGFPTSQGGIVIMMSISMKSNKKQHFGILSDFHARASN